MKRHIITSILPNRALLNLSAALQVNKNLTASHFSGNLYRDNIFTNLTRLGGVDVGFKRNTGMWITSQWSLMEYYVAYYDSLFKMLNCG